MDVENLDSQPTLKLASPNHRSGVQEKTHVLIVKQRQTDEAYGSENSEGNIHRLYLSTGENALILKQTSEHSILMDTQEQDDATNHMISYVLSFEQTGADFIVNSEQYLYFDVTSDNDIVTIKDYRTPRLTDSSPSSRSGTTDDGHQQTKQPRSPNILDADVPCLVSSIPMVGIASYARPSHFEELPLRQLRVLEPGDRICTNFGRDTVFRGEYILEYRLEDPSTVDHHHKDPHEKQSMGLLTQPQEEEEEEEEEEDEDVEHEESEPCPDKVVPEIQSSSPPLGSASRRPVEDVHLSLLTQPDDEDDSKIDEKERRDATRATDEKSSSSAKEQPQLAVHDNDDDSEMTMEMTQHVGSMVIIEQQTSLTATDPPLSIPIKEVGKDLTDDDSDTTLGETNQPVCREENHPAETSPVAPEDFTSLRTTDVLGEPQQSRVESTIYSDGSKLSTKTTPLHSSEQNDELEMVAIEGSTVKEPIRVEASIHVMSGAVPREKTTESPVLSSVPDTLSKSLDIPTHAQDTIPTSSVEKPLPADQAGSAHPTHDLLRMDTPVDQTSNESTDDHIATISCRDLLASPSQDVSTSLLRETGVETPIATVDDYESNSLDANDNPEEQEKSQDCNLMRSLGITEAIVVAVPDGQCDEETKKEGSEEVDRPPSRVHTEDIVKTQDDEPSSIPAVREAEATSSGRLSIAGEKHEEQQTFVSLPSVPYHENADVVQQEIPLAVSHCGDEENRGETVDTHGEAKRLDEANGRDHDADDIVDITEKDERHQQGDQVVPKDGYRASRDSIDKDADEMQLLVRVELKTSASSPVAPARTNSEAKEIAKSQIPADHNNDHVRKTRRDKAKLEENTVLRRQESEDRKMSPSNGDKGLPVKPRFRKRDGEGDVVPASAATKRPRTGPAKSLTTSSMKSNSTTGSIPASSRNSRRSPPEDEIKQISIMGTRAMLDKEMIKKLGGTLYENIGDASKASHLVVDVKDDGKPNLIRTPKFMIAVARGCQIVHINFYKDSIINNQFMNDEKYLLWGMSDAKVRSEVKAFEKKYSFRLEDSITRARKLREDNRLLLTGIMVYICPGVAGKNDANNRTPIASEFRAILEGAGATVIKSLSDSLENTPKTIIITSKIQKEATKQKKVAAVKRALVEHEVVAMTTDELFDAIMSQILP